MSVTNGFRKVKFIFLLLSSTTSRMKNHKYVTLVSSTKYNLVLKSQKTAVKSKKSWTRVLRGDKKKSNQKREQSVVLLNYFHWGWQFTSTVLLKSELMRHTELFCSIALQNTTFAVFFPQWSVKASREQISDNQQKQGRKMF